MSHRIGLSILFVVVGSCRTMPEGNHATPETESTTDQGESTPPTIDQGWIPTEDYRPPESFQVRFDSPPGWIDDTPSDGTHLARYRLPSADESIEKATLTVDYLGPGGTGARASMINRWAGMFEPAGEAGSGSLRQSGSCAIMEAYRDSEGHQRVWCRTFTDFEACGTYVGDPMTRAAKLIRKDGWCMLATIHGGARASGPYYVRLVGPATEVSRWGAAYEAFLRGAKPND